MTVPTRPQVLKAYRCSEKTLGWGTVLKGPLEEDDAVSDFFHPRGRLRIGLLIFLAAGAGPLVSCAREKWWLRLLVTSGFRNCCFRARHGSGECSADSSWGRDVNFLPHYGPQLGPGSIPTSTTRARFQRFPLPFSLIDGRAADFWSPIPSFWWLAGLMTINPAVVLFWKWRRK